MRIKRLKPTGHPQAFRPCRLSWYASSCKLRRGRKLNRWSVGLHEVAQLVTRAPGPKP